jgi:hypothetical protein
MKGPKNTFSFRKTADCPSSTTLLAYRSQKLSAEVSALVQYHLAECDFCRAELALLAHHLRIDKREERAPEIPMNLRILAESLLCRSRRPGVAT